jgi:hypothetical protein
LEGEGVAEIIMLAPQRVMEIALQKNYPGIPSSIRKRYSELLVARAVKFYIESDLDVGVVEEDLYHGEDFDCTCSQEDAHNDKHQALCQYAGGRNYVNLDYSEQEMNEWQKDLKN